jgi:hypothetical protein
VLGTRLEASMDVTNFLPAVRADALIFVVSFLIAALLAIAPGHHIVRGLHNLILHNVRTYDPTKTLQQLVGEFFGLSPHAKHYDPAGGLVGCLERSVYVFAIMFAQPGVITGVLILKAFFGWVEKISDTDPDKAPSVRAYVAVYYAYIIGNLISLIVGLALGELGFLLFPRLLAKAGIPCLQLCG